MPICTFETIYFHCTHVQSYIYIYILGYMQHDFMVFDRCISNYPVNDVTNVNDFFNFDDDHALALYNTTY